MEDLGFLKNSDLAISIYSIPGKVNIPKNVIADNILANGLTISKEDKFSNILNPKGLARNINSIYDVVTTNAHYLEKEVCNVVIGTPEVISLGGESYYIGYPRDNTSGYSNASHQKDYSCYFTDWLENEDTLPKEMIIGYYYGNGNENYFFKNKDFYGFSKEQSDFYRFLLDRVDTKIVVGEDREQSLVKINSLIKSNSMDYNSMYHTLVEYMEFLDDANEVKSFSKDEFINILKDRYQNYALYLHGVDNPPKLSKSIVDFILRSCLHIDEFYGFAGTCEPKGPVNEITDLYKALDYHYRDNHECSYNLIILTPKVIDTITNDSYFVGYSRNNTTGTFPKSMKDFDCLLSDAINKHDFVPREFIFAYHVYGPNMEDKFVINPRHYSFLGADLQKIFGSEFFNIKDETFQNNLKYFSSDYIGDDMLYALAHPIVSKNKLSSEQTTSLEYFEFLDSREKEFTKIKKYGKI